jgi:hypothetical protein
MVSCWPPAAEVPISAVHQQQCSTLTVTECSICIWLVVTCDDRLSQFSKSFIWMSLVFGSNYRYDQVWSAWRRTSNQELVRVFLINNWGGGGGIHGNRKKRSDSWHWKINQAKVISNRSLMTEFIKENYWVIRISNSYFTLPENKTIVIICNYNLVHCVTLTPLILQRAVLYILRIISAHRTNVYIQNYGPWRVVRICKPFCDIFNKFPWLFSKLASFM